MALPPVPSGVGRVEVTWAIGTVPSSEVSNGFWIYSSGLEARGETVLQQLLSDWIATPLNTLLSLVPNNVSPSTCRLTTYGVTPLRIILPGPAALGGGGPCTAINAALVLSWRSALAGQGSRSTTWLPLPRDAMDGDCQMLTTSAYGSAQGAANAYLNQVNSLVLVGGGSVEMVTLSRRSSSAPFGPASFSPVVYGHPARFVGTLDRRIRSRGRAPTT